jgi:nitrite reductase (NO-forming)
MQGEIYSDMPYGQHGSAEFSVEMLLRNARNISSSKAIGTLSWHHPLQAKVGERVRIFFGVGGPNRTSSLARNCSNSIEIFVYEN